VVCAIIVVYYGDFKLMEKFKNLAGYGSKHPNASAEKVEETKEWREFMYGMSTVVPDTASGMRGKDPSEKASFSARVATVRQIIAFLGTSALALVMMGVGSSGILHQESFDSFVRTQIISFPKRLQKATRSQGNDIESGRLQPLDWFTPPAPPVPRRRS